MDDSKPHKYTGPVPFEVAYNLPNHGPNDPPKGSSMETEIWAMSPADAQAECDKRGLGEKVDQMDSALHQMAIMAHEQAPAVLPSEWFDNGDVAEALHAACWLGMVAIKAGVIDGFDLLNDNGVIHQLAHLNLDAETLANQPADYLAKVRAWVGPELRRLEALTPGFAKDDPERILTKRLFDLERAKREGAGHKAKAHAKAPPAAPEAPPVAGKA